MLLFIFKLGRLPYVNFILIPPFLYHLANIMSRVALLCGDKALVDEYNERVADKLNTKLSAVETVGFHRGMQQMMFDLGKFHPFHTFFAVVGGLFDAKKQYRLMSLLLSDLGVVFDIRYSTPWQISTELQSRGIFGESETVNIKVCLSIANKIRLKTYFVNKGQKELFSPVPNTTEESGGDSVFQDLGEDVVVHLVSNTNDIFERCRNLCAKLVQQDELDIGILRNPSVVWSKTVLLGAFYFRLQNFPKALEWYKLVPKDSPGYSISLNGQGVVHFHCEEYEESIKCFENALEVHHQNEGISGLDVFQCTAHIALTLLRMGKCEKARSMLEKAISEHDEIYGKGYPSITRGKSMQILGGAYFEFGDMRSALETFQKLEQMYSGLANVPDIHVIFLNLAFAMTLDRLNEHTQALKYINRTLQLAQKVFGEWNLSITLVNIYMSAAFVYENCHLNDEALSFLTRSLNLLHVLFGDSPCQGKMVTFKGIAVDSNKLMM